jgi:hypothetical protein
LAVIVEEVPVEEVKPVEAPKAKRVVKETKQASREVNPTACKTEANPKKAKKTLRVAGSKTITFD